MTFRRIPRVLRFDERIEEEKRDAAVGKTDGCKVTPATGRDCNCNGDCVELQTNVYDRD